MNKGELELSFRRAFQDTEQNYFVTSEEFTNYLNEAEEEACRRARLLVATDLSTGEIKAKSTITITGDSGSIDSVLVNNINIISNAILFTGSAFTTAALLSNEINSLGLYTATVKNNIVTIYPLDGIGSDINNIAPIVLGTLLTTFTPFTGGVNGICKISLLPNKSTYDLSNKIFKLNAVYYGIEQKKLELVDYREMDEFSRTWRTSKGIPSKVVVGLNSNKLDIYKIPEIKENLLMNVTYLPLVKMVLNTDVPSIPEYLHEKLIYWVLYRAYSKNDSETQNTSSANYFRQLFVNEFGEDQTTNAFYEQSRRIMVDDRYGDY